MSLSRRLYRTYSCVPFLYKHNKLIRNINFLIHQETIMIISAIFFYINDNYSIILFRGERESKCKSAGLQDRLTPKLAFFMYNVFDYLPSNRSLISFLEFFLSRFSSLSISLLLSFIAWASWERQQFRGQFKKQSILWWRVLLLQL